MDVHRNANNPRQRAAKITEDTVVCLNTIMATAIILATDFQNLLAE